MLDTTHPDIRFALDFVTEACHLTRAVHAALGSSHLEKSDLSPVSVADLSVQALAGKRLFDAFPDAVLMGEESADILRGAHGEAALAHAVTHLLPVAPDATPDNVCAWIDRGGASDGARFWTLDPVDGTKGFLRGDQYAVALALVEDGKVILGVLGCPNLHPEARPECGPGLLAVAVRGQGAWTCPLAGGSLAPLRVSPQTDPRLGRLLRSYEKAHTNASDTDLIMQALGMEGGAVTMDSQAKYAVLAAGGAELLLRLLNPGKEDYKERIWDQAAGSILLEEAGGTITDLFGRPLDFSTGRMLTNNTGVFASNGPLHDAGLRAIQQVCFSANAS